MFFSEIIGQEKVKESLINMVKSNRLSHAIMLFGQEGIGKKALSQAFAQYIVCENRGETDACGLCPACKKASKMTHPDIHYVFPVVKEKRDVVSADFIEQWRSKNLESPYFTYDQWNELLSSENKQKQSSIFVSESNEIVKTLNYKPYEADYKIVIIWLAEKMNVQTANKLLKTLEEPSSKTVLMLISENTDFILPTILSRVQMVKIPPISQEHIQGYLKEEYHCEDDVAQFAAHLSKGNLPLACSVLSQTGDNATYLTWFQSYMRLAYSNKMLDLIELNDTILKEDKQVLLQFLKYAVRYIRDNFMLNKQQREYVVLMQEELDFASKFSNFITENNIGLIYSSFSDTINEINRNANTKIEMQVLAINLVRAFKMI